MSEPNYEKLEANNPHLDKNKPYPLEGKNVRQYYKNIDTYRLRPEFDFNFSESYSYKVTSEIEKTITFFSQI